MVSWEDGGVPWMSCSSPVIAAVAVVAKARRSGCQEGEMS
jgi:hypothetical protein